MSIEEYLNKFRANQLSSRDDMTGKTVLYAHMPCDDDNFCIVFTDKTFFIGALENDYYDTHYISSRNLSIHDIYCQYTDSLTSLGTALGANLVTCRELINADREASEAVYRERRRLEYEKLKAEFEPENK